MSIRKKKNPSLKVGTKVKLWNGEVGIIKKYNSDINILLDSNIKCSKASIIQVIDEEAIVNVKDNLGKLLNQLSFSFNKEKSEVIFGSERRIFKFSLEEKWAMYTTLTGKKIWSIKEEEGKINNWRSFVPLITKVRYEFIQTEKQFIEELKKLVLNGIKLYYEID